MIAKVHLKELKSNTFFVIKLSFRFNYVLAVIQLQSNAKFDNVMNVYCNVPKKDVCDSLYKCTQKIRMAVAYQ